MPRTAPWLLAALFALAATATLPRLASADEELIPPKTLVRKFPGGQYCPLPISLSFTAPVEPVIVTFTAAVWVLDGANGLTWTQQLIDNVTVSPTSQVVANTLPPPAGSQAANCYVGDPSVTPYYRFNRAGLELDLLERFDTDPTARGWDMSHGAYFTNSHVAPRNVETAQNPDETGGSLGLGNGVGTPVAGQTARSSITLSNLNVGVSYDLGAWWYAGFVHYPHDIDYLTVTITTLGGVPVAKRSWGSIKGDYR